MSQDIVPYLREVRSQITRADEAADLIQRLRAALELFAKCEGLERQLTVAEIDQINAAISSSQQSPKPTEIK